MLYQSVRMKPFSPTASLSPLDYQICAISWAARRTVL
jgi:hypothetical protein